MSGPQVREHNAFLLCSDLHVPRKCSVERTGSVWQAKYTTLSCVETPQDINSRGERQRTLTLTHLIPSHPLPTVDPGPGLPLDLSEGLQ